MIISIKSLGGVNNAKVPTSTTRFNIHIFRYAVYLRTTIIRGAEMIIER